MAKKNTELSSDFMCFHVINNQWLSLRSLKTVKEQVLLRIKQTDFKDTNVTILEIN